MNKERTKITDSVEETFSFARQLASECEAGDIICLYGTLGAGKTHFVKGFASAFGIDPSDVDSPTFVLIQEYNGRIPIYHFDAYRIESLDEARGIGTEDYLYGDGICVIEWPEKIAGLLPEQRIDIHIEQTGAQQRSFKVVYRS